MLHKLEVKLKQHTPLIHFQHDQEGATLRASEVKPKLDRFILTRLTPDELGNGLMKGWIKSRNGKTWLDYQLRFIIDAQTVSIIETNSRREYSRRNEERDKKNGWTIRYAKHGEVINPKPEGKVRFVIKETDGSMFFGRWRKTDSRILYDLDSYPCFFANMGSDICDSSEYRMFSFCEKPFDMIIITKHQEIYGLLNDLNRKIVSSFFFSNNFGTRQSKGFGSFYIDESDDKFYEVPQSQYHFDITVNEEYYDEEFISVFQIINLFTKTIRAGINEKRGKDTVFYFKSLAFMYCKDVLRAEWDKKRIKSNFYRHDVSRRQDSLNNQRNYYPEDDYHDILFFDSENGYDIRDLLGFSTNEEWQSYKDSIEKKVAIKREDRLVFPERTDTLPVERMRSPLLIKPICQIDEEGVVSYSIYLLFQDDEVGMKQFKQQQKVCIYSTKERDDRGRPKRFMLNLPESFSMKSYFDYIFDDLRFNLSEHIEERYHGHLYFGLLDDIYSQLKNNRSK